MKDKSRQKIPQQGFSAVSAMKSLADYLFTWKRLKPSLR